MLASICTRYGPPNVLAVETVAKPAPAENEILVRLHASVVGPSDVAFRKGDPFIVKLIYGLSKPRMATQGVEFAGQVEAVGQAVTRFKPGDKMFGMSPAFGAHAEYLTIAQDKPIALLPSNATYEQAVAVCDGATTSLTFLRDVAKLQSGQRLLINGASGSLGVYGIQLAKYYGAHVTGVCSTRNLELVKSLGADEVIDYTQEDFTKRGETYDVVYDAVGKSTFSRCKAILTPHGMYLSTVPTLANVFDMLVTSVGGGKKAKFVTAGLMQNSENLEYLRGLIENGTLKPVIDRRYPLREIAEAHRYVEAGHKRGNVIITLAQPA